MTLNSFSDCTQRYETTLDSCTCKDRDFCPNRPGGCKHMQVLVRAYERARKATFDELRRKYDSRLNGQADTRRCNFELALGI